MVIAINDPEEPKDDPDKYPHGVYFDSDYHHKNRRWPKSPPPIDGQRCLDYSIPYDGPHRICIEDDRLLF